MTGSSIFWGAGRLLGNRDIPAPVWRAMGFAHNAFYILLLGLIPGLETVTRFIAIAFAFMAYWMAAAVSLKLKGWRAAILPLVVLVVLTIVVFVLPALFAGVIFTLDSLLGTLGLAATP